MISKEQQYIIDLVNQGKNVIVNAVCGSGKTTSIVNIIKEISTNILVFTYSKRLMSDTKKRIETYPNSKVYTYHSFCRKYYQPECQNDTLMKKAVEEDTPLISPLKFNIIILDEAQDMTPLYFKFIIKVIRDNDYTPQIVVLGDEFQSIFEFNGSDNRFLKYCKEITFSKMNWEYASLSTSFRLTQPIANFVNHCLYNQERIHSIKESQILPTYLICDIFKTSIISSEIISLIARGFNPSDIFILTPSVKSKPVTILENKLKTIAPYINIFVTHNDETNISEDMIKDKLVFTTFHQC
jgi:superfamily I DNA/RNA helicase